MVRHKTKQPNGKLSEISMGLLFLSFYCRAMNLAIPIKWSWKD